MVVVCENNFEILGSKVRLGVEVLAFCVVRSKTIPLFCFDKSGLNLKFSNVFRSLRSRRVFLNSQIVRWNLEGDP